MRRRHRRNEIAIPEHILSADGEWCSPLWEDWCEIAGYSKLDFIVEHVRRQLPPPRSVPGLAS